MSDQTRKFLITWLYTFLGVAVAGGIVALFALCTEYFVPGAWIIGAVAFSGVIALCLMED